MRKTEVFGRAVLVSFGLLAAVFLLEAGLQFGALVVRLTAAPAPTSWFTGGQRILCLGDSNTYGVWLEHREQQAWPSRLESLWNEADQLPRIEVLNVGYPGTNSSQLLRDFPRMLDVFRPDLVLVMVGVNDFWTADVPISSTEKMHGPVAFLRKHSRVYKLWGLMIRRLFGADGKELEVRIEAGPEEAIDEHAAGRGVVRFGTHEFVMGYTKDVTEKRSFGWLGAFRQNLRALAGQAHERGVELLLLTYPARHREYAKANDVIRRAAKETGTHLVDLERVFVSSCPDEDCPEWFFGDHHPRATGHELVARTLVEDLGGLRGPYRHLKEQ